jgi:hypothetical protein
MDRHVARMEELTGLRQRTKTWWVRGSLLGQGRLCMYALALGSSESPASALDRHELAHSIFSQHAGPDADPPTLLMEGWAETQSLDGQELVRRALNQRRFIAEWAPRLAGADAEQDDFMRRLVDPVGMDRLFRKYREEGAALSYLRALTDPFWYHHDNGPVYPVGGAFVDFLVRKYGAARFVELSQACLPGTFEPECRRVYGIDLDALERDFWQDVERADIRTAPRPPGRSKRSDMAH